MPSPWRAPSAATERSVVHDALPWLLVGLSVRPLAEAAAANGHEICAIDAFGDRDTLAACAGRLVRLAPDSDWRIDADNLRQAVAATRRRYSPAGFAGIAVCSGVEAEPALLDVLGDIAPLLANDRKTVDAVRTPQRWFSLLDDLGAPYPTVQFSAPDSAPGWLTKSADSAGGRHVRRWHGSLPCPTAYFQRLVRGRPASALFLAAGHAARVVGWQWQRLAPTADLPWRFGGVMTATDMPEPVRRRVARLLNDIVAATGLHGLCGLDFLVQDEGAIQILELNPRPTASVALYADRDLFAWHRDACAGHLPEVADDAAGKAVGEAIVYANGALQAPPHFPWPNWCRDIPAAAGRFAAGEPVCSVRASAESLTGLRAALTRRLRRLQRNLEEKSFNEVVNPERQRARRTARPLAAG
jgi:predicted ATP-grasp superfamily ATP-dependent carboligase